MQTWRNDFAYLEKIINILLTVSVVPFKKNQNQVIEFFCMYTFN